MREGGRGGNRKRESLKEGERERERRKRGERRERERESALALFEPEDSLSINNYLKRKGRGNRNGKKAR